MRKGAVGVAVSVILATAGRQAFVRGCLRAIAGQKGANELEVCIVNDGGPSLASVLREFSMLTIRYQEWRNQAGQVAARNAALEMARGDVIAVCDDDDRWLPQHMEKLWAAYARGDALCYTDAEVVWLTWRDNHWHVCRRTPFAWRDPTAMLRLYNPIMPSSVCYPRWLHRELGGFDPAVGNYWDWDFWLRASAVVELRRVPECLTLYAMREDGTNLSAQPERMRPDLNRLVRKHGLGNLPSSNFALMAEDPQLGAWQAPTTVVWDGQGDLW
jgi:glycosyltransferase involved in cell wall biosynthesis